MELTEILHQYLLPALTGLGGLVVTYLRSMSKDVKSVADSMKDLSAQVKLSVLELKMDFTHIDEKVEDVKDRLKIVEKRRL